MNSTIALCLSAVLLAATALVRAGTAPQAAPSASAGATQATPNTVVKQMHENFSRIGTIELAVIRGDLEDIAGPARWLAQNVSTQGFPPATEAAVSQLRTAAQRAANATDLAEAAAAAGELVASCGACHVAAHAEVSLTTVPKPPEGKDTASQMRQHNWAVELMSLGLVEPSDALWKEGAQNLATLPLTPESGAADPAQVRELAEDVKELARNASQASATAQRAQLYGQMITTCGSCHSLNGVLIGPGLPME